MKYKLINTVTKTETICDKVTIDGFDYYVSDEIAGFTYNKITYNSDGKIGLSENNQSKKVIATNNPNIDCSKIIDEVKVLAFEFYEQTKKDYCYTGQKAQLPRTTKEFQALGDGFIVGYNKSQETHPFSEDDMIDFVEWVCNSKLHGACKQMYEAMLIYKVSTVKELLQIWQNQKTKILYYD